MPVNRFIYLLRIENIEKFIDKTGKKGVEEKKRERT